MNQDQSVNESQDLAMFTAESPRPALESERRCCTVCDAKKKCSACGSQTLYACSDCRIDFGVTIYVCPRCQGEHEAKCSARIRERLALSNEALQELFTMVNYALDARDALLISKTCATMGKARGVLNEPERDAEN